VVESIFNPLPCIHHYLEKWAGNMPHGQAVIQHEEKRLLTYEQFNELVDLYVLRLVEMGLCKGDRVAGVSLHSITYLALQFACFKTGVIVCPLDIKLKTSETISAIEMITPRVLFLLDDRSSEETRALIEMAQRKCSSLEHFVQFRLSENETLFPEAEDGNKLFDVSALEELRKNDSLVDACKIRYEGITTEDPALIIFTTGTTSGAPKPAVLQHQCVIAQMEITELSKNQKGQELRMMCSLPDSHVGGTTIQPYSAIYSGGTAILVHRFNPRVVLEAISQWRATWFGAVPMMFRMMWCQPDYDQFDLSSLRCVYYAGSTVNVDFLEELSTMAEMFGTSLGMTETAGFATISPFPVTPEELAGQVGMVTSIANITIREPMAADGSAGEELPIGELGEICYHPPLVFLGYFGMPEETAKAISQEGILYSGDIGCFENKGSYNALYIKGRKKFMVKQKGYNVFPDEVAAFISQMSEVKDVHVVGATHRFFDEGVVAFVKKEDDTNLSEQEVLDYCKGIASYKRPQHVVLLVAGEEFPVNRVGKIDLIRLTEQANCLVEQLRNNGGWDASCC